MSTSVPSRQCFSMYYFPLKELERLDGKADLALGHKMYQMRPEHFTILESKKPLKDYKGHVKGIQRPTCSSFH